MICNGKQLFLAMALIIFRSCCLACSVIGIDIILFMYLIYAASFYSNGRLDVKFILVSVCVGFL